MIYVDDFIHRIEKMTSTCQINAIINLSSKFEYKTVPCFNHVPQGISDLYCKLNSLQIINPRQFELLPIEKFRLINDRYLHFATINYTEKLGFNISQKNVAGEWDIMNINNDFLITYTLGSFLTTKIWRWINYGKEIWQEEYATNTRLNRP